MQLHRLELTAFGPFAGTATVDFDALGRASVFLLCGDTGAGKTTVLDGVCFALYGDVPSRRASARQLRSQHAADGVAPRVVLEVTVASRRLRFTRSPAWQRPKKKGSGTTTEQAHVLVEERDGGDWVLRTNRLDEAGHLVAGVLGMTLAQFSQVVLLPQGQFDTFLRSSSEERQKLLTQLFQTQRFEQVEAWFAERRRQLWRANGRHHGVVAGIVHRLSEAAGVAQPDGWDTEDLAGPAASGEVRAWAGRLLSAATGRQKSALAEVAAATEARARAEGVLAAGRRSAEVLRRKQAALVEQDQLVHGADGAQRSRALLEGARRAAPVAALGPVVDEAARSLEDARTLASAAVLRLAHALDTDPETARSKDLGALEDEVGRRVAAARAFLPRARELRDAQIARAQCLERSGCLDASLEESRERLVTLPEQRSSLVTDLTELRRVAERRTLHEMAGTRLEEQLAAATSAEELALELESARAAEAGQLAVAQSKRECWLEVREQRLNGMAAELAAAMVVGGQCPVCGSAEHPAPARVTEGAVTRADEQAARKASEDAQVELEAHRDQVHGLAARLATARELSAGRPAHELATDLAAARAEVDQCRAAGSELSRLEAELAALDEGASLLNGEVARTQAELAATHARAAELASTVHRLSTELADLLGGEDGDLQGLIASHEELRSRLANAREALAEVTRCDRQHADAVARIGHAAATAGFRDATEALAAHLPAEELAALEQAVADRDRREQEVRAVLADPEVVAAGTADPPVLDALEDAYELADLAHTEAVGVLRVAEGTLDRLQQRSGELDEALAAWGPAREEYSRVRALAELVEGKGSANTRQMRLSAYVLASRLSQVVEAANERLDRMVDHRYVLEHSDARSVGDKRGGLSLAVRDQWTDERRDPVTLSGGETFVVSLALALGLADVVTAESGGTRIDTLFVDEGFGSLDADTLEQVMDTLDELREGGRVVGVVSHVAEMRDRIPTQLRVVKGRTGSRLEQAR